MGKEDAVLRFRVLVSVAAATAGAVLLSLSACAGLGRALERPHVQVLGADVQSVSLDQAELTVDFSVENPNSLAVVLRAVGYRLRINGEPFLDGRDDRRTEIAARGESRVRLPVTFRYADVLRVLRGLRDHRSAGYELEADFRFSVPVGGDITVPVSKRGEVPLDRIRLNW
jgi:LEA14-like dessication related protein